MIWRDSMALAALLLVPATVAFFWWAFRERDRALATFVEAALLPAVVPDLDRRRRRMRAGLLTAAVAAFALALAGPMWGFHWEEVRREGIDLVVAFDTSKSMLATDVTPNRLARAKLAVQDLLAELEGDRIGLVAFAGTAFVQCPLTLDRNAFRESLEAVEVGLIPRGGTNLTAALESGLAAFEGHQGRHQALVLITDGEDHEGKLDDVIAAASKRGVKIFTVGIGTAEGELIPTAGGGFLKDRKGQVVKSRLGEDTLKKLALDTGGVYLHAAGADLGLAGLYRDHIATMEKRDLESTLQRRYEHRYQLPLLLGLVLLVVEQLLGERRLERAAWRWRRRRAGEVAS
jgi:Ca-activated chloride channel family protein